MNKISKVNHILDYIIYITFGLGFCCWVITFFQPFPPLVAFLMLVMGILGTGCAMVRNRMVYFTVLSQFIVRWFFIAF